MSNYRSENPHNKRRIWDNVTRILREMSSGWEMQFDGSITPETLLGADLAFTSLDFVRLVTAIQQEYIQKHIPFQDILLADNGEILEDIRLSYLVDFLHKHLNNQEFSK